MLFSKASSTFESSLVCCFLPAERTVGGIQPLQLFQNISWLRNSCYLFFLRSMSFLFLYQQKLGAIKDGLFSRVSRPNFVGGKVSFVGNFYCPPLVLSLLFSSQFFLLFLPSGCSVAGAFRYPISRFVSIQSSLCSLYVNGGGISVQVLVNSTNSSIYGNANSPGQGLLLQND